MTYEITPMSVFLNRDAFMGFFCFCSAKVLPVSSDLSDKIEVVMEYEIF